RAGLMSARQPEVVVIFVLFATSWYGYMEHIVNLHIERLPEGVYLATSDEVPGLVAQGRTIAETVEIARDIAKKLIEAQGEGAAKAALAPAKDEFDYPLVLAL